jgi:YHS domain-containing protein
VATDPVCKMNVDENSAAAKYDHKGKTYYFSGVGCKGAFSKDPGKFLKKERSRRRISGVIYGAVGRKSCRTEHFPCRVRPLVASSRPNLTST